MVANRLAHRALADAASGITRGSPAGHFARSGASSSGPTAQTRRGTRPACRLITGSSGSGTGNGDGTENSIGTAITCCRWTAPPISPPPRSIVPPAWRSTIATAASPIPINCWGPPWSIPTSRKSSRWHPSRSSSRTVRPRTTASGTPPAAGSNGFARSIPTCRSSSSKTPSAPTPPPPRPA